jgi:hypothetical protein
LVLRPAILPLYPLFEAELARRGARIELRDDIVVYTLEEDRPATSEPAAVRISPGGDAVLLAPQPGEETGSDVAFGDELALTSWSASGDCPMPAGRPQTAAGRCELVTVWRVLRPASGPRRFFVHALDAEGRLLAQADGLGAPAAFWRAGDMLFQRHTLELPAGIEVADLLLGVYNPETAERLRAVER